MSERKEIKRIRDTHRVILDFYRDLNTYFDDFTRNARSQLAVFNAYFDTKCRTDIARGTYTYHWNIIEEISALTTIYIYKQCRGFVSHARALRHEYEDDIENALKTSSILINPVRRFFTSERRKQEAERAYRFLQTVLTFEYVQQFTLMKDAFDTLPTTPFDVVHEDFLRNNHLYVECARELTLTDEQEDYIPAFLAHMDDYTQYRHSIYRSRDEACKALVRECEALREGRVQEILNSFTLNTLKNDIPRLRVKALEDAGLTCVGDISRATVGVLEDIPGIASDTAYQLKGAVKRYARQTRENLRVRFNPDEPHPDDTRVLKAAWRYRQWVEYADMTQKFEDTYESVALHHTQSLLHMTSLAWFFLGTQEKNRAREDFLFLQTDILEHYREYDSQIRATIEANCDIPTHELWQDFARNNIQYVTAISDVVPDFFGDDTGHYGVPQDLVRDIDNEDVKLEGLHVALRRYQQWGVKYILHQENVLLGDDMGLGKTIQAIGALVALHNAGKTHFLVVCPASVVPNWCREIEKKSVLRAVKIHGDYREQAWGDWIRDGGVAVTTYETTKNIALDESFTYGCIIVDEAHFVKNPRAQRTKNVLRLAQRAERRLFMTGTALENNVKEMISLVTMLREDIARDITPLAHMLTADVFREKIAPVYLRRTAADVLHELPDVIEREEWCELTDEEKNIYERTILDGHYVQARRVSWNIPDVYRSSKAQRLIDIVEKASEDNRKIIIFSFFLDTINAVQEMLGERCLQPITGSVRAQRRQEIIDEFGEEDSGAVLLAQIQAGALGLNIQDASVVIFCEPQIKPALEKQAIGRAHRMGQARTVMVYRLLAENTIDERIMKMLARKQNVFDTFAEESVAAKIGIMDEAEYADVSFSSIIEAEIERIKGDSNNR